MSVKLKGTVKWFDTTKGFGFLLVDDDKGDVLLHANVCLLYTSDAADE